MTTLLWVLGVAVGWLLAGALVSFVIGAVIRYRDRQAGGGG